MDFWVVLKRNGKRVNNRKHAKAKIGIHQKITKADAQQWFVEKLGGTLIN
jgi:large subunit ribosomal protein L11e